PDRLEAPGAPVAAHPDALDRHLFLGQAQMLGLARAAIARAERDIDQGHVEAEKPGDRPGAHQNAADAHDERRSPQDQHHQGKAPRRQAAIRRQPDVVEHGGGDRGHGPSIKDRACRRKAGRALVKHMKRMTPDAASRFFAILAQARPDPATELQYINPYTLLVAVVLSAQATDVSVNKATEPLFKLADDPAKMV